MTGETLGPSLKLISIAAPLATFLPTVGFCATTEPLGTLGSNRPGPTTTSSPLEAANFSASACVRAIKLGTRTSLPNAGVIVVPPAGVAIEFGEGAVAGEAGCE